MYIPFLFSSQPHLKYKACEHFEWKGSAINKLYFGDVLLPIQEIKSAEQHDMFQHGTAWHDKWSHISSLFLKFSHVLLVSINKKITVLLLLSWKELHQFALNKTNKTNQQTNLTLMYYPFISSHKVMINTQRWWFYLYTGHYSFLFVQRGKMVHIPFPEVTGDREKSEVCNA